MNWKDSSSLNISMSRHDLRLQRLRAMIEFKAFEGYVFDAAGYLRYRYQHTRIHAKSLSVEDRETKNERVLLSALAPHSTPRSIDLPQQQVCGRVCIVRRPHWNICSC